jgi:hypothetical protein
MIQTASKGKFPFSQGIQHPQFFRDGPRRQIPPQRAFALDNSLQVKAHGASLRNCRSNFRQLSTNPCRTNMA